MTKKDAMSVTLRYMQDGNDCNLDTVDVQSALVMVSEMTLSERQEMIRDAHEFAWNFDLNEVTCTFSRHS